MSKGNFVQVFPGREPGELILNIGYLSTFYVVDAPLTTDTAALADWLEAHPTHPVYPHTPGRSAEPPLQPAERDWVIRGLRRLLQSKLGYAGTTLGLGFWER